MLDTTIVSALIRDRQGPVFDRLRGLEVAASVSVVVAGELRFGASRSASPRLESAVEAVLGALAVEPMAPPVSAAYGRLRADLERAGRPMDANDLWIAAHALVLDRTLVTHDHAFDRVPGLKVEDWLAPAGTPPARPG